MPSLFVIHGRDQGLRFEVNLPRITIGRIASNQFQLHDTEVSREHAELIKEGDSYSLRDLGSSNGTHVNGRKTTQCELHSGDQIQLGRTLLLYTGIREERNDLTDQVRVVPSAANDEDGSRIVSVVSQSEGSELFGDDSSQSGSPWLARARSNLQIMYRTALAVSHTLDIDQLLSRIMDMIFEWGRCRPRLHLTQRRRRRDTRPQSPSPPPGHSQRRADQHQPHDSRLRCRTQRRRTYIERSR